MDNKKDIAAEVIEDLIKVNEGEAVEEDDAIELTAQQKSALDKELASIAGNPGYLQKWNDVRHRFKKP